MFQVDSGVCAGKTHIRTSTSHYFFPYHEVIFALLLVVLLLCVSASEKAENQLSDQFRSMRAKKGTFIVYSTSAFVESIATNYTCGSLCVCI